MSAIDALGEQARTLTDEALAAAPDNVRVLRLRARLEADADNHDAAREVHTSAHPLAMRMSAAVVWCCFWKDANCSV